VSRVAAPSVCVAVTFLSQCGGAVDWCKVTKRSQNSHQLRDSATISQYIDNASLDMESNFSYGHLYSK
jgi:hypothetical protein